MYMTLERKIEKSLEISSKSVDIQACIYIHIILIYVYVCIYMYVHISMYIYVYFTREKCRRKPRNIIKKCRFYSGICMYILMLLCMYTNIYVYICIDIYAYIHVYTNMLTCIYICILEKRAQKNPQNVNIIQIYICILMLVCIYKYLYVCV
jgi:hypothetical protein